VEINFEIRNSKREGIWNYKKWHNIFLSYISIDVKWHII
jgi:hypothetical protein